MSYRLLFLFILSILPYAVFAQDDFSDDTPEPEPDSSYTLPDADILSLIPSCAHPDSNIIQLPGGHSPQLTTFVDKLDSVLLLGKGHVSILQIGGSHVQADMHTNVFRQRLDSLNGGLHPARGILFPYSVAKTNTPLSYRIRYSGSWSSARCSHHKPRPALGVTGITVYTSDPTAWISFNTDPDSTGRWTSTSLRILTRHTNNHLTPRIILDDKPLLPTSSDGISYTFSLPHPTTHFQLALHANNLFNPATDTFFVDGVIPGAPDDGITFHTIGVNGASTKSFLRCELFERQLHALHPDLIIMSIGVNDASGPNFDPDTFRNNYDKLISIARQVNPNCALIFISNNDTRRRVRRHRRVTNTNGPLVRDAFLSIAEKWQGGFYDLFSIMGGLGSMQQWQKAGLAQRDCVHFSRQGYAIVGALFYDAFLNFYLDQDASDDNYIR